MSDVQLMQSILENTKTMVKMRKQAKFSDLRGENPETMPGSANDSSVNVPGADPEVKKRFPGEPAGARTMSGAGDNSQVTRGHALTAEESALTPSKKPMIENEAMNVELDKGGAADLGNDLLSTIKKYKDEKRASEGKKLNKVASEGEATADPSEGAEVGEKDPKNADSNKDKNVPSLPAKKDATPGAKNPAQSTSTDGGIPKASQPNNYIELSQDILAKIASILLGTQEGCDFAEAALAKAAGAEAAKETMSFIRGQKEEAEKVASYQKGQQDAEAFISNLLNEEMQQNYKQAYDNGANEVVEYLKSAGLLNDQAVAKNTAYAEGAQLAESLIIKAAQDIMAGGGGEHPMDPAMMGGAPEAGGAPPEAAAGGEGDGQITPEEIGQALAEMVASGELKEEEAAAIIQQIEQATGETGGDAALGGGGAPPETGGAEAGDAPNEAGEGAKEEAGETPAEETKEDSKEAQVSQLLALLKNAQKAAAVKKAAAAPKVVAKKVTK